ncbi:MAG: glycosyltransferase [Bacteroidetes bacterium]|nr:glycosyltransferase [Bacteroidota bacterium]
MSSPLVSVIIPVYNAEKYIEQTIRSVLNQTFQDFEIIVLNDGSTDKSLEIIKGLASQDNRIIYIDKTNTGVSDTRNVGIENTRGSYIAFLDADDIWKENNLSVKIHTLNETGSKWTFSDYEYLYENDKHLHFTKGGITPTNIVTNLLLWEKEVVPGPCSNIIVHRSLIDEGVKFDTRLSSPADRDICLQLASRTEPIFIDQILWIYRQHEQSMTTNNTKVIKEMIYLYKKADEQKWFVDRSVRRKAYSNMNLKLAGMSYYFPSKRYLIPYFLLKAFWYSPLNVINKTILKNISKKKS